MSFIPTNRASSGGCQADLVLSSGEEVGHQNGNDGVEQSRQHQHEKEEHFDETASAEKDEEALEKHRRRQEAKAQALTLEIIGDLPDHKVKPPEYVLFVCKLNPVTQDEDLDLIFSRFGKILSCEVIRDKRTGDSLQYAFIEFDDKKNCEQAYFKMQGVLIDDHRIHVDFSQSVSKLSETWRNATNSRRAKQRGGFGGISELEKKRQYRAREYIQDRSNSYGMVIDREDIPEVLIDQSVMIVERPIRGKIGLKGIAVMTTPGRKTIEEGGITILDPGGRDNITLTDDIKSTFLFPPLGFDIFADDTPGSVAF